MAKTTFYPPVPLVRYVRSLSQTLTLASCVPFSPRNHRIPFNHAWHPETLAPIPAQRLAQETIIASDPFDLEEGQFNLYHVAHIAGQVPQRPHGLCFPAAVHRPPLRRVQARLQSQRRVPLAERRYPKRLSHCNRLPPRSRTLRPHRGPLALTAFFIGYEQGTARVGDGRHCRWPTNHFGNWRSCVAHMTFFELSS